MLLTKTSAAFSLALLTATVAFGQETWSLERCILHARDNNITIKQAQASVRTALLSERQAKANRLPSLSASFDAGEQFGRTVDPTTNTFSLNATGYNSLRLSAGAQVFAGGQIHHAVKQANWSLRASEADAEQTMNSLALQIAQSYLTILLTEEQLKSAQRRISQSSEQLKVTQKLIEAGTLPLADKYTIEAQIARDEQAAVTVQNNLDIAYLNLKQFLQLEPDFDLRIERPAVDVPADARPDELTLSPLYATATTTQPSVRAAGFRLKSAAEGIEIAKAAYFPTVTLFANLSSNYSTQFPDESRAVYTGDVLSSVQKFRINGQDLEVQRYIPTFDIPTLRYFDQIDQNFGQGVGVSINIPIYQNGRTRLSVERARLALLNAEMQNTQTQQQLKSDIQTAIANARAGRRQLEAAQKSFAAMQTAFQNMEKRHAIGAVNSLDLTTSRNNLNTAENDLIVAKYDYLFRLKILDFYQGKSLDLK